jgi:sugar lactone lactonase YvrE
MRRKLALLLLTTFAFAQSPAPATAKATVRQLRLDVQAALKSKDNAQLRTALEHLAAFTHDDPDSVYNLACTYALAGDKSSALTYLERWASMGLVLDAAHDTDLASLVDESRFKAVLARIDQSRAAITHSTTAFTQTDPALLTEDLAYDPRSRNFFVTSVLKKKVLRIAPDGHISDFADLSRDPGWPLLAVHADPPHNALWVTAAAFPDFVASPKSDYGRTLLLKLDLRTGRILDRMSPPDSATRALGDMDIAPDGTLVVGDSFGAAVFRLAPGAHTLQRIDADQLVSPQTPAITPDSRFAYVADYTRGIARIDLRTHDITWLSCSDRHPERGRAEQSASESKGLVSSSPTTNRPSTAPCALTGIDGLNLVPAGAHRLQLIAMQNGTTPPRIIRLTLNPAADTVTNIEVLEANYPALGDPTHGVFVARDFYFIANSGWSVLDDHGTVKPGATMTPATIRKLTK